LQQDQRERFDRMYRRGELESPVGAADLDERLAFLETKFKAASDRILHRVAYAAEPL